MNPSGFPALCRVVSTSLDVREERVMFDWNSAGSLAYVRRDDQRTILKPARKTRIGYRQRSSSPTPFQKTLCNELQGRGRNRETIESSRPLAGNHRAEFPAGVIRLT